MGLELPSSGYPTPRAKPSRSLHIGLCLLGVTIIYGLWTQATRLGTPSVRHVVPINAQLIMNECKALYMTPGPPAGFSKRSESDRYEDSAYPTLITNATIWTGNKEGKETIPRGEIYLEKGIIKYVGERAPAYLANNDRILRINARLAWVTPSIVDMHSHLGVGSAPELEGSDDTNSFKGLTMPWLRSLDGIDTHDQAYKLSISGGVSTSLILPGSANAIGGQAFIIKLRDTKEKSPLARVLEPPYSLVNGTKVDPSIPPRWRHMKHAAGENPGRVYDGTRMDTIWAFRSAYNEARKLKNEQDEYCAKAQAGLWTGLSSHIPQDLKWEALVDVLRGRVKVNIHSYETVDFTSLIGLSNEFLFPLAALHHSHEAYLAPDVIKQAWGGAPGVAVFATNARYKREAYRGSEFAPKILHDNGIRVAMKSDHPVLNSRYLLYEAAQAHHYGLEAPAALAAVTSTPAELIGMGHRIGYLRPAYDADLVIWDSHPLALGATPKQVFIDGIAQLKDPYLLSKPDYFQEVPESPNWDKEAAAAVEHDGLPPLDGKQVNGAVAFINVGELLQKATNGKIRSTYRSEPANGGVVIVDAGHVQCSGTALSCSVKDFDAESVIDLKGGSIVPGLTTFGSGLGLVEIEAEPSTNDGEVFDVLSSNSPSILEDTEILAVDGLQFAGRNSLLAYRSGVTAAIVSPRSNGQFSGLSAGFFTGASHKLEDHAVLQRITALHARIGHMGQRPSVSTQIAILRKALSGNLVGDRGDWYKKAAEGQIPLVVDVSQADHIATVLELKREIDEKTGKSIQLVLVRASEAHILAKEIAEAGVGVILIPPRMYPGTWDSKRVLPGPPLTAQSAVGVLSSHNIKLGVGVVEEWEPRNQRLDIGWAALESNGSISRTEAIALASSNIESLLGLEVQHDLVAYVGGDVFDLSARTAAIISPRRGFVEIF